MKVFFSIFVFLLFAVGAQSQPCTEVKESVGRRFSVSLEGNPTTGYEWLLASVTGGRLQSAFRYTPLNKKLMGSGGRYLFKFKASRSGEYKVVFQYKRSWEDKAIEYREYLFTIK